jgi:hypothetical protein
MKQFVRHGSLLLELTTLMAWERSQRMSVDPQNVACMTSMKHGEFLAQKS